MTGTLSQIVTLTSFGNDFLYNDILDFHFFDNLSFKFCNLVDFRVFKKPFAFMKEKEMIVATHPNDWFQYSKKEGCRKLRLYFRSSADQSMAKDYKLAGFVGGGGTWLIEAVYDNHSNAWANRWDVTQKDDPNQNVWTVNYAQTLSDLPTINLQIDQQICRDELEEALSAIEAFAFEQSLDYWKRQFAEARATLQSNHPEESYYNKHLICSDHYSLTARQILHAAATAWVFGGMGSWNDLVFDTQEENHKYETLTEALYASVNRAILSAVNSY